MKKKVLIIFFRDLIKESRVISQIVCLKDKFSVYTAGYGEFKMPGVTSFSIKQPHWDFLRMLKLSIQLKLKMFEVLYWAGRPAAITNLLKNEEFDVIIAHSVDSLPLVFAIKRKAKVILDAHEYYPRQFEDSFLWRFFFQEYRHYLCKKYIRQCDKMITVCETIADEYRKNFDVNPMVVTNASDYYGNIAPTPVEKDHIRLIHHGLAFPSRKIENMIEMMDYVDRRFTLDLMLVSSPFARHYLPRLRRIAQRRTNVRFLNPVPTSQIVSFTNHYDIGIYILEGANFNQRCALPNKFFEFIQARLAIAIGPSLEMAKIVKRYNCGFVAHDFSPVTMAAELNNLTKEKIDYYKQQSDKAAFELSSTENCKRLNTLMDALA